MGRASNGIITIFNVLFLFLSIIIIGFSIWFQIHSGTNCQKVLQKPLLILGLVLLFVSLLGLIGACCGISFLLWLYLVVLFLLIVGLFCSTVITIIVTNKKVGDALSNKGFDKAKTGDYSNWLRKNVVDGENWDKIKTCLADVQLCQHLKGDDIYKKTFSSTQSGCCIPPSICGFESKNATMWTMPKSGPAVSDSDCAAWSNDQKRLCFDCNQCKAAFLENLKGEWKQLTIINLIIFVIVIFFYSVGCCALRNNRSGKYNKPYYD